MNKVRGILSLVAAVSASLQLLGYLSGIYYPSKGFIVLAFLVLIGTFLKWSVESFESMLRQTNTKRKAVAMDTTKGDPSG